MDDTCRPAGGIAGRRGENLLTRKAVRDTYHGFENERGERGVHQAGACSAPSDLGSRSTAQKARGDKNTWCHILYSNLMKMGFSKVSREKGGAGPRLGLAPLGLSGRSWCSGM